MGGLSKKAYQLNQLRKIHPETVAIDSGGLLFKQEKLSRGTLQEKQFQATAKGIISAYNTMEYKAVGVASQDLAAGLPFLLDMQRQSKFPWISSNLVSRAKGNHLFSPQVLIISGKMKIGILGLTGSDAAAIFTEEDDATLLPWQKALPAQISKIKDKADMIILLSNLSEAENKAISEVHPNIHIILQCGSSQGNIIPALSRNTVITQVEPQGKHVGLLRVTWDKRSKKWQNSEAEQLALNKTHQLDRLSWQISRFRKNGDPLLTFKDQPAALQAYQDLVDERDKLQKEISQMHSQREEEGREKKGHSTFANHFYPMDNNVPDDREIRTIVDATTKAVNDLARQEAAKLGAKTQQPSRQGQEEYSGHKACMACHEKAATKWQKTLHARAYDTLKNKEQHFNLRCLPCHVTGAWNQNGEQLLGIGENRRHVGCESCHGPARIHALSPDAQKPFLPGAAVCLECHTTEHDDDFNFESDLARLGCGN